MTGQEMIDAFLVYYDRITSFSAPGYTVDEILLFLNNAQDEFVRERTFGKNFQPPAIDDNQKRAADLYPLIQTDYVGYYQVVQDTDFGDATYMRAIDTSQTIWERLLYILEIRAGLTRTAYPVISSTTFVRCEEIKNSEIPRFMTSAINKTHFINPKYVRQEDQIFVIHDSYTDVGTFSMTGVRKPYPILQTSLEFIEGSFNASRMSLHPSTHQEIVDIAVRQALQVLQDPRWQTKVNEQQITDQ